MLYGKFILNKIQKMSSYNFVTSIKILFHDL